jgi:hypothetical protein
MTRGVWLLAAAYVAGSAASAEAQFPGRPVMRSRTADQTEGTASRETSASPVVVFATPDDERIQQALQTRGDWNFVDVPIERLPKLLNERLQIATSLDVRALDEAGVDREKTVSGPVGVTTMEAYLERMLSVENLTYTISQGILVITTIDEAELLLTSRVYPIRDLHPFDSLNHDASTLIQLFFQGTSGEWEDYDGVGGTISYVPQAGALAIRQTQRVHREIEAILNAVRRARRLQGGPSLTLSAPRLLSEPLPVPATVAPVRRTPPALPSATASGWRVPRVDRD